MTNQGPETYNVTAFDGVVQHEFQQMTSKLYPYVTVQTLNAAQQCIDSIGQVEMKPTNGRFQPIVFDEINHMRRGVGRKEYSCVLPIDEKDARVILENQPMEYAKAIVSAAQRQIDRIISECKFADVQLWTTDSNGVSVPSSTALTFANDGGIIIDATAGLTYAKIVESKRKFVNADVDLDSNEFVFMGTGDEMDALMNEDKFINSLYSKQMIVDDQGILSKVGGIVTKFFSSGAAKPVVTLNTNGTRACAMFVSKGITLAVNKEVTIKLQDRTDLMGTKQVLAFLSMGAVRNKKGVVQQINTTVKS
jgi:hypothetical protein